MNHYIITALMASVTASQIACDKQQDSNKKGTLGVVEKSQASDENIVQRSRAALESTSTVQIFLDDKPNAKAPECNADTKDSIIFFSSEKSFKQCNGEVFVELDLIVNSESIKTTPDVGEVGPKGEKGNTGLAGATGLQGAQGERGDPGVQGEKGDQGAVGVQGAQGSMGAQGEAGEQGETGAQGETGDPGLDGTDQGLFSSPTVANLNLTVSDIESFAATLTWTLATPASGNGPFDYEYMVLTSTTNTLSNLADATEYGVVELPWSPRTSSHAFDNLTDGTTYNVVVLARNSNKEVTVFNSTSFSTLNNPLFLHITSVQYDGDFGGRAGGDTLCRTDHDSRSLGKTYSKAIASFSASDEIKDFSTIHSYATDFPVKSPNGTVLTKKASSLFDDDGLETSLLDAGLTGKFWTGSYFKGVVPSNNCTGFTDNSSGVGYSGSGTSSLQIDDFTGGTGCSATAGILCLSWSD